MASTVEEIAYYCEEKNTFGALLLSGDWGCGKTYLLEHDVAKRLGDRVVMLRLSLFGETSVEAIRKKIQKEYFNKILEQIGGHSVGTIEEIPGAMDSANAWIYKAGELSGVEKIFALNPSDYIKLEPKILGKNVILIFDDLERCHLSQAEALGCINEYCENLHMKTIIVANEEKIKDWQKNKTKNQEEGKKDFLAYSEIKEKIVVRTVRLTADYDAIVSNIFNNYQTTTDEYVPFLQSSKAATIALINDCEIKNIRSLRCGFQDFEKLFRLCKAEGIPDDQIRKYFTSFVLFELLAKGGQISKSVHFGYGLNRLQQKYPGHYEERYMPNCVKDWVLTGAWPEEEILEEIRKNAELQQRTAKPQNLLRSMNLLEMDDETVAGGWNCYLQMAYDGKLTMEEYVRLIRNLINARTYAFTWPEEPKMDLLAAGVEASFRAICRSDRAPSQLRDRIDEATLKKCTDMERSIYGKIVYFNDSRAYLYGINRTRILTALQSKNEQEIFKCRGYEMNRFDEELAAAVIACYEELDNNQRRIAFIDSIRKILWNCGVNCSYGDMDTRATIEQMKEQLRMTREQEAAKPLKAITTNYFLTQLDEILAAWEKA